MSSVETLLMAVDNKRLHPFLRQRIGQLPQRSRFYIQWHGPAIIAAHREFNANEGLLPRLLPGGSDKATARSLSTVIRYDSHR